MKTNKFKKLLFLLVMISMVVFLTSCAKDKTTAPTAALTPEDDVADVVATNMALNTGGAADQIEDLTTLLDNFKSKEPFMEYNVTRTYDSLNGWWNIIIERTRGTVGHVPYSHMLKVYKLQYLNINGDFQKHYITDNDTARTVNFDIISGEGVHKTRRLSQNLQTLTGDWTITHANLTTVTINGTFVKAATDTLITRNGKRIMSHTLNLNFTDVQGPRHNIANLHNKISGEVNGTFVGDVTVVHGDNYTERHIERTIHIVFGNGVGDLEVGGYHSKFDILTGDPVN